LSRVIWPPSVSSKKSVSTTRSRWQKRNMGTLNQPARPSNGTDASLKYLSGQDVRIYARQAARLVSAGRLNKSFPDPFGCEYFTAIAAAVGQGVYDGINIHLASGLPPLKDMLRVQVDREIAQAFLDEHQIRAAPGRSPSPEVQAKVAYYR